MERAVFDIQPLYRIDLTGLRSSQGSRKKIITAAPINTTPQSLAGTQKKLTVFVLTTSQQYYLPPHKPL